MRPRLLLAALEILAVYVLLGLIWLAIEGAAGLGAVLFFALALRLAAGALWWSARGDPPRVR
ncbi:MAG TPA: hypothetical protein VFI42_19500 [Thermomicrobiaceae bacterium]|nr:hypothetical protein [Thermomicrobiaceae bacterium]